MVIKVALGGKPIDPLGDEAEQTGAERCLTATDRVTFVSSILNILKGLKNLPDVKRDEQGNLITGNEASEQPEATIGEEEALVLSDSDQIHMRVRLIPVNDNASVYRLKDFEHAINIVIEELESYGHRPFAVNFGECPSNYYTSRNIVKFAAIAYWSKKSN